MSAMRLVRLIQEEIKFQHSILRSDDPIQGPTGDLDT
jgi:hypothetical protein